jgi:hypothetical protein
MDAVLHFMQGVCPPRPGSLLVRKCLDVAFAVLVFVIDDPCFFVLTKFPFANAGHV